MSELTEPVLLCVSGPKTEELFREMVVGWRNLPVVSKKTCRGAWSVLQEATFRIVIIVSPLSDGNGYDLAKMASDTSSGVILVCKHSQCEMAGRKLNGTGVYVFSTAFGRKMFEQALLMMDAVHTRLKKEVPQTKILQDKLRDFRVIGRAKCLLIQYEHMTEDEAHKMIERQAMDRRISARSVADDILRSYAE